MKRSKSCSDTLHFLQIDRTHLSIKDILEKKKKNISLVSIKWKLKTFQTQKLSNFVFFSSLLFLGWGHTLACDVVPSAVLARSGLLQGLVFCRYGGGIQAFWHASHELSHWATSLTSGTFWLWNTNCTVLWHLDTREQCHWGCIQVRGLVLGPNLISLASDLAKQACYFWEEYVETVRPQSLSWTSLSLLRTIWNTMYFLHPN